MSTAIIVAAEDPTNGYQNWVEILEAGECLLNVSGLNSGGFETAHAAGVGSEIINTTPYISDASAEVIGNTQVVLFLPRGRFTLNASSAVGDIVATLSGPAVDSVTITNAVHQTQTGLDIPSRGKAYQRGGFAS